MHDIYDITVIGGGPVGLFGAFWAGLRNMRTKVIEGLPQLGGQLTTLYPEKQITDVPGYGTIRAQDLVDRLISQASAHGPTMCLGEEVREIENVDGIWELRTQKGVHHSRIVLVAVGLGSFTPKRPSLERLDYFEDGRRVVYSIDQIETYRDRRVVVAGGGNSALDWVTALEPVAKQVTLVHRHRRFQAHERTVAEVADLPVEFRVPYEVRSLNGDGRLESVTITSESLGLTETIPADACLFAFGFRAKLDLVANWGFDLEANAIRVSPGTMTTSLPGVLAAGDAVMYPGKVKTIASGIGEVVNAVSHASSLLRESVSPNRRRRTTEVPVSVG